jgi:hypothetical protein
MKKGYAHEVKLGKYLHNSCHTKFGLEGLKGRDCLVELVVDGKIIRGYIQKFPDWPAGARTANDTALFH